MVKEQELIEEQLGDINSEIFENILSYNLNASDEKVLIIGDEGFEGNVISPVICNAYQRAAEEMGLDHEMVLQSVRFKGEQADDDVISAMKGLPEDSIIVLNVSQKIGKLGPIGLSFRKFCRKKGHRFVSASSLGVIRNEQIKDIMRAYDVDYEELSEKAEIIKEKFDAADEIRVTTDKGTDLLYNVEGMEAVVSDGVYPEPGTGGNLPGTETYIPPKKDNVEGKIVVDGSMRTRKGTKLIENPVEMDIRKGAIVGMKDTPESQILEETLRWAHEKAKYPWGVRRIGEFGLGLNPNAEVIGCTVVDEKAAETGHFAIGSNYWFGGSIYAIIHLDQVFHDPVVEVDGEELDF